MNADTNIEEFKKNAATVITAEILLKGAITGVLEKACGGKANRYLVLKVLTGKTSSKLLSESEWYALMCMVQPCKPVGGHWHSARDTELERMCGIFLTRAVDVPEQGKMSF